MDELFEQFMIEGRELISQATDDLSALEEDPMATGRIDSAFRAVHTLKGSVAIFDLAPMGVALHAAEDLLEQSRSGRTVMERAFTGPLLACLDQCDRWMDAIEESGGLPVDAPKEAVRIATGLVALTGAPGDIASVVGNAGASWVIDLVERHKEQLADVRSSGVDLTAIRYAPRADCFFSGDDPLELVSTVPELVAVSVTPVEPWPSLDDMDPYRCNLLIELVSSASIVDLRQLFRFIPDQVEFGLIAAPDASGPIGNVAVSREAHRTIRVDSTQIDKLLDLLGELVVAKNGLAHLAGLVEAGMDPNSVAARIRSAQASTDSLVAQMHETVMAVRMISLDRVFQRLTRMVRGLSQRLERDIAFSVEGSETRVDKSVADTLFDPLLHIVRNAIDHGIEDPDVRRARGKPAEGRVTVRARAVGDEIAIEVVDDGAGIDPAKVRQTAIERQVGQAEGVRALDDEAAIQLIFAPGFSTASAISEVSGRGIGMDVVKTTVERLGGRVSLESILGQGTNVRLRLPASAALSTVLVVRVASDRYAVPLESVSETVRVPRSAIRPVGLGQAFVLRGKTLPFVELARLLGHSPSPEMSDARVVVVETDQGRVGVAVDDFSDRLDVMLRPMAGLLANVPGVSGTTLLGDGTVLLILDLAEVIG